MSDTKRDDKQQPPASPKPASAARYGGVADEELEDLFLDYGGEGRDANAPDAAVASDLPPEPTLVPAADGSAPVALREPAPLDDVEPLPPLDPLEPVFEAPPGTHAAPLPGGDAGDNEPEVIAVAEPELDESAPGEAHVIAVDADDDAPEMELEAVPSAAILSETPIGEPAIAAEAEAPIEAPPSLSARRPEPSPVETLEVTLPPLPPPRQAVVNVAPAAAAVAVGPPPPPPVAADRTPLNDHATFRAEAQKLARAREWQKLAAVTLAAVDHGSWATLPEMRAALLLDLARIHRDRLNDAASAVAAFRRLAQVDPGNDDAIQYLSRAYEERGDFRAIYDLYSAAIEPTWDPQKRLEWTRETARIAGERLRSTDLAIEAWERLERLGDAVEETYAALSEMYRRAGRWDRLAQFLGKRAAQLQGAERVVAEREVAEAYLLGLRDADPAAAVLEGLLDAHPDDVVALLAYARVLAARGEWEGLAALGARSLDGVPRKAVLDFRHVVAEALLGAGQTERAAATWERVLELDADDETALAAKEALLRRAGRADELSIFLAERAERARTDEARARLLASAALLCEEQLDEPRQAAMLWEKRVALPVSPLESYEALSRLYERLGDLPGAARALEGQLGLVHKPEDRVPLLRRLGEHSAHRMGDDARAEACWKEILSIVPGDRATHDELLALHRRRGDFEALDRALGALGFRSAGPDEALTLSRLAAQNVDENLQDSKRAVAAFERVLDLAPRDTAALAAAVRHRRTQGRRRDLIDALEAELRTIAAEDVPGKKARALEIARLWEEEGARVAALSAYERVLRWDPTDETALTGVALLRKAGEVGAAVGAFEVAAAERGAAGEKAKQIELLRDALGLPDAADALGRFFTLRRILWLSGCAPSVLAEVEEAAAAASAWAELAAVYRTLASEDKDPQQRAAHLRALAKLYEVRLSDAARAFLVLSASDRRPVEDDAALAELSRLADATGRYEDLLALLDASASVEVAPERRREVLRRRAEVLETKLQDPARAFTECVRLLQLDPDDAQALADVRRLAEAKGLWRALDALYAERWDRAGSDAARVVVARQRAEVRRDKLGDALGALDQLLVAYRLDPSQEGLADEVLGIADREDAWDRVLPIVEARARAAGEAASPDDLNRLAGLHEHQREDVDRAFELYAEAFILRPSWRELEEDLGRIAEQGKRTGPLASVYRVAAARAGEVGRKLELYGRVTHLQTDVLKDPAAALDAHRRILQLDPAALGSLEVVIGHHREAGEWRDLRDRLQQWIDQAGTLAATEDGVARGAARIPRLLEIARISHERLSDREAALAAYAKALELDPDNAEAQGGVRSLGDGGAHPRFDLQRLRVELPRAPRERRIEIQLACAQLERGPLGDGAAAVRTLTALVDETGADGPGYEPLAALLRERGETAALVDLIEARASRLSDAGARGSALAEALLAAERPGAAASADRRERLYRKLLDERPDDVGARRRLIALEREAGRSEPLAELLRASIASPHGAADDDERRRLREELARVLAGPLSRPADAEAVLVQAGPKDDPELLLFRARLARQRGDFAAWLDLRQQHAKKLPPVLAALVYCHLAEACDETPGQSLRVAGLYREARGLDAQNPFAMEALKAIGRRAKNWRQAASLLQDEGESQLGFGERALRLKAHGDAALPRDPAGATDFYQRAIAVDPDCHSAWDALSRQRAAAGDVAAALEAQRSALYSWERATPPSPAALDDWAARLHALSVVQRAAGDEEAAARLALAAHRLAPGFAAAALAVADAKLAAGEEAAALALFDGVLTGPVALGPTDKLHATYRRGALAWKLGRRDTGLADLRAALALDPLHPGALNGLAEAQAETGRIASAAEHYVQALLVEHTARGRAALYARLGRLWEDQLKNADEAGVCYDLAIAGGAAPDVPDLMSRALSHYRRQGLPERALDVIERLLPSTEEPRELAALWTERGAILGSSGDEDRAVEAYDMALSYDPGSRGAITGLSQILERRGDWEQLAQIFEARTETGTPDERAEALRALARMASAHLKDNTRAARYLRSASELAPAREDFEQLLALYGDDPAHFSDKQQVLSGLFALGGPFMPRVIDFGRALVQQGERRWAWCVLSPLMNSTLSEPQLKSLVLELRKEFEKSDNTTALAPDTHTQVAGTATVAVTTLAQIVAELDHACTLGRATLDEAGAHGTGRLDERTAVGKTFAGIAARLGLEGTLLSRAQELPEPFVILDGPEGARHVVVRAELLQLLSIAETGFLFSAILEQTRPGARLFASLPAGERDKLVPALYAATGAAERAPGTARLVDQIRASVPADQLGAWGEALRELGGDPAEHGARLVAFQAETARRVGLVAAADLRFAARVLTRLDETLPKLQTVGRIDDLDEFIGGAAPVRALLAFAVTPLFGRLLHGASA